MSSSLPAIDLRSPRKMYTMPVQETMSEPNNGVCLECGCLSSSLSESSSDSSSSGRSTPINEILLKRPPSMRYGPRKRLDDEAVQLSESKRKEVVVQIQRGWLDEDQWKQSIREQIEEDLERRVREALETPPLERLQKNKERAKRRYIDQLNSINSHIHLDLTEKERDYVSRKRWKALQQAKRTAQELTKANNYLNSLSAYQQNEDNAKLKYEIMYKEYQDRRKLSDDSAQLQERFSCFRRGSEAMRNFGTLTNRERQELYHTFTKQGFENAVRLGHLPDGSLLEMLPNGKYQDEYGIIRDHHGPFWPRDYGPLFPPPDHKRTMPQDVEPLITSFREQMNLKTIDTQVTKYTNKWRGTHIVFDSEKSGKDYIPPAVQEGHCPSLLFESRFESGNLRQARRVGQFEYELVLKTDLYTKRHTQWFYFRVQNMVPGITYKFIIVNLLKRDSLYNHGMRPLFYSEKDARTSGIGWARRGHHILYSRNMTHLSSPVLFRDRAHFMLEWQMEFDHVDDSCYFAHCYPYTYTDLKDDLDMILADPDRGRCMKREVMCETRAGNSCFLLTITNFGTEPSHKKRGVVVTARVHPGESNSSWMMKGLLDFLTSNSAIAQEIRNNYIFKIVPMLNPDGVIVGNYRCSLAARDLNRNYRHPKKENFPTIWHTKEMTEDFTKNSEIVIYCDMHGHSRKSQVFMYGCDSAYDPEVEGQGSQGQGQANPRRGIEAFINERLFPWLMSKKSPEKFSFNGCKFHIRRCKEATGRVVMWRQMRIMNSFTMEATFSGTPVSKEEARHFNINDFQDMGKVFCETVLEYQATKENQTKKTDAIVDITRAVTHQILQAKGMLAPELLSLVDGPDDGGDISKVTQVLLALLSGDKPSKSGKGKGSPKTAEEVDVNQLMNNLSAETIQGCFKILEQLNATDELNESDSSDSDSESEPEMPKASDPKRKKKKKSRKQRDRDFISQRRDKGEHKSGSALPAIGSAEGAKDRKKQHAPNPKTSQSLVPIDQNGLGRHYQAGSLVNSMANQAPGLMMSAVNGHSLAPSINKCVKVMKSHPQFVSKYEGKHNNGIPWASEERSNERAAKRMAEMKKRMEEEKQREAALYFFTDDHLERFVDTSIPSMRLRKYRNSSQDSNGQDKVGVTMNYGSANIAQALMDFQFKTSYQHADDGTDGEASLRGLNALNHEAVRLLQEMTTDSNHSDSDLDDLSDNLTSHRIAAMHNPYTMMNYGLSLNSLGRGIGDQKSGPVIPGTHQSYPQPHVILPTKPRNSFANVRPSHNSIPQMKLGSLETLTGRRAGAAAETKSAPSATKISTFLPALTSKHQMMKSAEFYLQTDNTSTSNSTLTNNTATVLNILQNVTSKANQSSNLNKRSHTEFFLINYRLGQDAKHASAAATATTPPVDGGSMVRQRTTLTVEDTVPTLKFSPFNEKPEVTAERKSIISKEYSRHGHMSQ
ncbi:uncharacterized protein LOC135503474 isoform X3 [Lineus longissimus]|uniref:uncharacterized protein LOC135503474 isoform X3 n=1 Tax=Lineus longissimus TaxID=88925 RepID=UPI00315CD40C